MNTDTHGSFSPGSFTLPRALPFISRIQNLLDQKYRSSPNNTRITTMLLLLRIGIGIAIEIERHSIQPKPGLPWKT